MDSGKLIAGVRGERVMAVGGDTEVQALVGGDREVLRSPEGLVVPGFIDTHIHFYEWAIKRQGVKLDDLTHLDALLSRVRETAENRPPDQWIMGQGWNETLEPCTGTI